ncbi:hypothetical protein P8452_44883 [Trifolium repens]|nr:hypothetical protein P8452_44883 [Trifolium repens]
MLMHGTSYLSKSIGIFIAECNRKSDISLGFISVIISDKGLDFVKDILINQTIESIVLSQLPQIEKSVQVPLVGKAHVVLSEITIKDIQVSSSYVEIGDSGINVVVSGATANLNLNWRYTYSGTTTVKGMIGINVVHKLVSLIKIGSRIGDKKHKLTQKTNLMIPIRNT